MVEVMLATLTAPLQTAVLVVGPTHEPLLSPFSCNSDRILLIVGGQAPVQFYRPVPHDGTSLSDAILRLKPGRLICGFVDEAAKKKLNAAGVDVRLGSCSCSIAKLVADFNNLPPA